MIECDKDNCKTNYIGESDRPMKIRFAEHKGYVRNNIISRATGADFNLSGHSIHNMTVTIIAKVKKMDELYRKNMKNIT